MTGAGEVTSQANVDRDVACMQCEYNLRGLVADGKCPECGHSIADSLAEAADVDAHRFIRERRTKVLLVAIGLASCICSTVPHFWMADGDCAPQYYIVGDLFFSAGVLLWTIRLRAEKWQSRFLRWGVRLLLVFWIVGDVRMWSHWSGNGPDPALLDSVPVLGACLSVAGYNYLASLARQNRWRWLHILCILMLVVWTIALVATVADNLNWIPSLDRLLDLVPRSRPPMFDDPYQAWAFVRACGERLGWLDRPTVAGKQTTLGPWPAFLWLCLAYVIQLWFFVAALRAARQARRSS